MNTKVILSVRMPTQTYFGGVATITSQYLQNLDAFSRRGYDLELFDFQYEGLSKKISSRKIKEIIYVIQQNLFFPKLYKNVSKNTLLHIQTSRKWTLMKDLILARTAKKKCHLKTMMTIHFADANGILYKSRLLSSLQMWMIKKYVDHIIFLSSKTKDEFVSKGYSPDQTSVEYTFHSFPHYTPNIEDNCSKPIKLLFVGSLDERKGILDLLEVLLDLKEQNWSLTICGQFTDQAVHRRYEHLTQTLENKIRFLGYISGDKKVQIFQSSDVLVLPSYGEGMPIVIMEAMASGCAIISTNVGAIPEVVGPVNGVLVYPGQKDDLKDAIVSFLINKGKLQETQLFNAEYARQFGIEEHIGRLCDIYDSVSGKLF